MLRIARLFMPLLSLIALLMAGPALADDGFLEPDAAFKFSARMVDGHTLSVSFQIADGYYMYRERFKFSATGAKLGALSIPAGTVHFDETFQKNVEIYRKSVTMTMPVEADGPFTLTAVGQGCSDKGLCYAPQEYKASLVGSGSVPLPGGTASAPASAAGGGQATARTAAPI
ncbi:protein-disulfide reductase DsbD, partial [Rugamonas sp. FT82W]